MVEARGAQAVQADLATSDGVAHLLAEAERRLSGLDILVNNAAAGFTPTALADVTDDDFDTIMAVNTRAAFQTIRHATRTMGDGGRIVNISSINTTLSSPGIGPYPASKGAVEQLTSVAALELGPRGITVNTVSPGATDTDLLRGTNSAEGLAAMEAMTPLRRIGLPADVAAVVAFLVGPDGGWVTGQNIRASGGLG